MDPELWPRLRRLPEQQRDLISTRRNDGLLTGRRCGTLSLGKPLKTSTSRNDGLLTGRRCGGGGGGGERWLCVWRGRRGEEGSRSMGSFHISIK